MAASAAGACLPKRYRLAVTAALTSAAAGVALAGAAIVLSGSGSVRYQSAGVVPLMGVSFVLDHLGALFTATIAAVAICTSLYAVGYGGRAMSTRMPLAVMPVFVSAMLLLPAAASVGTFLILWEAMAVASLVLVLADHSRRPEVESAGHWYAVMTQLGAGAILLALVLLASRAGSTSFASIRLHAGSMSLVLRSTAFVLAVVGFSSKAGSVPLHVWLPRAHPEAPGPISALMSAGMVNLGIYGIVRVGMWMLGGGPTWWWLTLMGIGAASALFGALHSATETDLKRLLAYSTTDNLGLVLLGVGASGTFASTGHRDLAAAALVAALLHLVFHAFFKGSLFLAAGSIQKAVGSKDLEDLGGVLSSMPVTGTLFLVGSLAISAVPPLSGFVSEWLLLQSFIHGVSAANTSLTVAMPIAVAALALTGGLTAVTFVKAAGIALLGRSRSEKASSVAEVPTLLWLPTGALAGASVLFGVAPFLVIPSIVGAASDAYRGALHSPVLSGWHVGLSGLHGSIRPALFGLALAGAIVVVTGLRHALQGGPVHRAEPWGCGRAVQSARMQYTATSFAEPLVRVFDDVLRPDHDLDVSHSAESRFYVESIAFHTHREDAFERHVYRPVARLLDRWGGFARTIQNGSIHRYLVFGMVAFVAVLVVVA